MKRQGGKGESGGEHGSKWVYVCVWTCECLCELTFSWGDLYTRTPTLQEHSPMTFVSICFHLLISFITSFILFSSPSASSLDRCYTAGLCYYHRGKYFAEQTDQGHCWQKSVILNPKSLRAFSITRELRPGTLDCWNNCAFKLCFVFKMDKTHWQGVKYWGWLACNGGDGDMEGQMDAWTAGQNKIIFLVRGKARKANLRWGECSVLCCQPWELWCYVMADTLKTYIQSHRAGGSGLGGKSDGPLAC